MITLIVYDIFYIRFWALLHIENRGDVRFAEQLSELQRK